MRPFVSIVTPSLNQAAFLAEAIASVAAQDRTDIEHRVYDGGSTDGTAAVLERHRDSIVASVGADGGQAAAVNRGLREARGEIIGWLNSDDFYYPSAVTRIVDYLRAHPECDVVYGSATYVDESGAPLRPYPTGDPADLRYGCFICQPAVFLRRRVVETTGGLDERLRYCMDYEWWLRIAERFSIHRIDDRLAAYRLHRQSKSVAEQMQARREVVRMTRRRLGATPLPVLYGYADFLVRSRLGVALDDEPPAGVHALAAGAVAAALALRYHPWPTASDLRLLATRRARRRTLAPGDFSNRPGGTAR